MSPDDAPEVPTWSLTPGQTFVAPADGWDDAIVSAHWDDVRGLSTGYFEAANELVEAAVDRRTNPNLSAAPILFLYRHAIELQLKSILGVTYLSKHNNLDSPGRVHRLAPLWTPIRAWLQARGQWDAHLAAVDENIELLDRIDSSSMAFRYPDVPADVRNIYELTRTNLSYRRLKYILGEVFEALDAIDTMRYEESQAEAEHYFENYDPGDYDPGV